MPEISIRLQDVRNANYGIPSLASRIDDVKRTVGEVRHCTPSEVADRYQIRQRLDQVCGLLDGVERQMNDIYAVVNSSVEQYALAEHQNNKNASLFE